MKTYFFETYGCEMNIAESAAVEQLFISRGWKKSESAQTADVAVINTCSIRETAENRILGRLGWFSGLKAVRECRPGAKSKMLEEAAAYIRDGAKPLTLIVMGCMAERLLQSFQKDYPFIDYVVGTYAKHHFSEIMSAIEEGRKPYKIDDSEPYRFAALSAEPGAFSTFVPIMHGCNNFCTYCIVPYVRGRERSRTPEDILSEIKCLAESGVIEIMLLGQNVNSYGKNLETKVTFPELLRMANEVEGIERIRFMTSHPKDLSHELIMAMKECKKVCNYIHLPVQSGSSRILEKMNRHYTKESYTALIDEIRKEIPDILISTDIIVGFPGETDEDIEDTIDVIKKCGFCNAFTFIYSKRTGTPAAAIEDKTPESLKKERFQKVLKELNETVGIIHSQFVGKTLRVVPEEVNKQDETLLTGRSDNNLLVHFKGDPVLIGSEVPVLIKESKTFYLLGEALI